MGGVFWGEGVQLLSPWALVSPEPGPHPGPGVTSGPGVATPPPPHCGSVALLKLLSPKSDVSPLGTWCPLGSVVLFEPSVPTWGSGVIREPWGHCPLDPTPPPRWSSAPPGASVTLVPGATRGPHAIRSSAVSIPTVPWSSVPPGPVLVSPLWAQCPPFGLNVP